MKKTLAIVLALVMVLAMIPAMGAASTTKVESTAHNLLVWYVDEGNISAETLLKTETGKNSITAEYHFDTVQAPDITDMWADNAKMALLTVSGWSSLFTSNTKTEYAVTVDGATIDVGNAIYAGRTGIEFNTSGDVLVNIPVEMTKAGYQDKLNIVLKHTDASGNVIEQTAVITLTMKNKDTYKAAKTATITNIAATTVTGKQNDKMSAYIVGSKIYLDYVLDEANVESAIKVTFANENGAAFSEIAYAYNPVADTNWDNKYTEDEVGGAITVVDSNNKNIDKDAYALSSSAAKFMVNDKEVTRMHFVLETKAADYITKDYEIVVRENIKEEDPKGIYFAETTKTIAMGETYAPVVMGVKTGKPVAATLVVPADTDKQVVDLVSDDTAVIGTREGVAYITATYTTDMGMGTKYEASSMKIIVTLPGESIPEVKAEAEVYYVTCRALNVRAGAGTSYKKVDLIKRGAAVKVVELKNGWAKLDDGTYVCAKYIAK